ncbi:MAG: transketolase family protein [Chloroflexota bacterium]|nr:MAG: transketolase family protein [Chloroflexota bacterium]
MGASTREAYGRALLRLGSENPDIVTLTADLAKSTCVHSFGSAYPERFFNVGVAEQNMMGIAAGLALSGKVVFASTFAVFASCRAFDQVRMSIAQPRLNVKIVATHGGITVGEDGATHHAIEDLALMRALPGFTVVVPADEVETEQVIEVASCTPGPFYVRTGRPKVPVVHGPEYRFELGRASMLRDGRDATIIATGIMVSAAVQAAEALDGEEIHCRVLNMATLKPLDLEAIAAAAEETGAIVTAEEHLYQGGLGSAVAQALAEKRPVPMSFVAVADRYTKSGPPDALLEKYGLSPERIVEGVRAVVARKVG